MKLKMLLLATMVTTLTACGGGGGGDSQVTTFDSGLSAAEKAGFKAASDKFQLNNDMLPWNGVVLAGADSTAVGKLTKDLYKNSIYEQGVTIFLPILDTKEGVKEATSDGYDFIYLSDDFYKDVYFGIAKAENSQFAGGLYRGMPTLAADMPKEGKASYDGQYINYLDAVAGKDPIGSVHADIDFANKQVRATIKSAQGYAANINGEIIGSAFGGKSGNKVIEGMFAGAKASEITGRYVDTDANQHGVFGAKR